MLVGSALATLSLLHAACAAPIVSDGAGAVAQQQPHARSPRESDEVRPIEWGHLNFLHTTDTHGWLAGHILERQFSGDWGDFVSFTEHMHAIADEKGVDLLIVDTGDRHDGNGLSDASKEDGRYSLPIFCEADYDLVTIGNHELYRGAASLQEFHSIRKHFQDRYVVSNVELAVGRTWVPLGQKYRLFKTKNQKLNVLALGFLFNFEGNDRETTRVTRVEDEMKKDWFQDLLRNVVPTVDYVVVVGHIPPRGSPEFGQILREIRSVNKEVPVSMFGGHSHIRDYRVYDEHAVALQAGRYVETIGWASTNLTNEPSFSRSYIDFNRRTMSIHAGIEDATELLTENGHRISQNIDKARKKLNLDEVKAGVPQTWYTDRAPYPSRGSIYTLLEEKVLPLLTSPAELDGLTRYVLLNTGAVRFDLFKGPYTKDTGYILSPFKNEWFYIANVPRRIADQVLPIINDQDRVLASHYSMRPSDHSAEPAIAYQNGALQNGAQQILDLGAGAKRPSRGYVTNDDLGTDGDDTEHTPWVFHPVPNAIQTVLEGEDSNTVALIFHDFVARFVEDALIKLGREDLFNPVWHGGEEVIDLIPQYLNSLDLKE